MSDREVDHIAHHPGEEHRLIDAVTHPPPEAAGNGDENVSATGHALGDRSSKDRDDARHSPVLQTSDKEAGCTLVEEC